MHIPSNQLASVGVSLVQNENVSLDLAYIFFLNVVAEVVVVIFGCDR